MNYRPLSFVLKQLQPKPESPHWREEREKSREGVCQSNVESGFRTNGSKEKTDGEEGDGEIE